MFSSEIRISGAILLLPQMDRDKFTITVCHVVSCIRSLIPKDSGVPLKFYDFVHPVPNQWLAKLRKQNLDFTFWGNHLKWMQNRRKCTVKRIEIYFKTYFCKAPDAPRRHHIWSKLWWCVHLPCTQLWTNKTQHTDIFSILHQLTASFFRTHCSTWKHNI